MEYGPASVCLHEQHTQEKILKFQIWVNIGYFLVKHWEFNGKLVSIPILGKEIHFPTLVSHI